MASMLWSKIVENCGSIPKALDTRFAGKTILVSASTYAAELLLIDPVTLLLSSL